MIQLSPYKGQLAELEKEIDSLIGFTGTGEHWKKEYYYREELIKSAIEEAPQEIVRQLEKARETLSNLREARVRWEELNKGINDCKNSMPDPVNEELIEEKKYRLIPIHGMGVTHENFLVLDYKEPLERR